jgi:uncharacterized membrane protein
MGAKNSLITENEHQKFLNIYWEESLGPVISILYKNKRYGLCFCHKIEERSIPFLDIEKYLCARCMGILFGTLIGVLSRSLMGAIDAWRAPLLIMPLIVDGGTQALGLRESNNRARLITGVMFGFGIMHIWPTLTLISNYFF